MQWADVISLLVGALLRQGLNYEIDQATRYWTARKSALKQEAMNIAFIHNVPKWNGSLGNWNDGRTYYRSGPKFGQKASVNTFVIHWMDGNLASTDLTFLNPERLASAHFGVEDTAIHQYVAINDTAYHSGNGDVNCESIGIEHSAQPGRDASEATYETSAQLCVQLAHQFGKRVSDFRFIAHHDVYNTQCCGTISVDRIRARALALDTIVLANVPAPVQYERPFVLPFTVNIQPSQTYSDEVKRVQGFLVGQGFMYDQGQNDGYYGPITQTAVNAFQRAHGLESDPNYFGWWWTKTRAVANQLLTHSI